MQYFRGDKIVEIPKGTCGVYAWYYKPLTPCWERVAEQIGSIFENAAKVETKTTLRYGMSIISEAKSKTVITKERLSLKNVLNGFEDEYKKPFIDFLKSKDIIKFMRPLYIGMSGDLYRRVYKEHFCGLVDYYDSESTVSRFLNNNPESTVNEVMDKLNIGHSFSLEARVRGITPNDLVVCVQEVDIGEITTDLDDLSESSVSRKIEGVLQLLVDPVCGRG